MFPGESRIATKLRDVDWSLEEVGPPDTWSPVVRNAISICIASRSPMQVYWGALRPVVYNAATLHLLDGRTPSVPARSGQELFGDEVWSTLAPMIERTFTIGEPTSCDNVRMPASPGTTANLVTFTLSPLTDDSGTVVGVFGSCVDVVQPTMLNTDRLSGAQTRSNDTFLSILSHELRNPLSALMTTLHTLTIRTPSPEIELMQRSARRLSNVVDNLLDVSRIARGSFELRPKVTELANVVDHALDLAEPIVTERNTQVFVRVPRVGMRLVVDHDRFAKAIANIIENAARYSEPGSRVWILATQERDVMRLVIKDEGSGIEPDRLATIFESFYQAPELRPRSAGLGLGLAIARSVVDTHGGVLRVTSNGSGSGTECAIELPAEARVAPPPPTATVPASRRRLLLVEDNDDSARALKNALEQLGYVVALAHDGPVALNVARSFEPDVVLMDIGLPVMDGWELAKRLRELRGAAYEAPVVAVTAFDRDVDKQRSADAGFADHLVKPIDLAKLQQVVERLPLRQHT
jgi:CheY-like chemotaxis protein/nitrogen-specific signal transduction histidine kinase